MIPSFPESTSLKVFEILSRDFNLIMWMSSLHTDQIMRHLLKSKLEPFLGLLIRDTLTTGAHQNGQLVELRKLVNLQKDLASMHHKLSKINTTCLFDKDMKRNIKLSLILEDMEQLFIHHFAWVSFVVSIMTVKFQLKAEEPVLLKVNLQSY